MTGLTLRWLAIVSAGLLAGCQGQGVDGIEVAKHSAEISGTWDENGEYSAEIALISDLIKGTFEGEMRNFHFSRKNFENPTGSIPISGTIGFNDEGSLKLIGTGEGVLSQGGLRYEVAITVSSGWVHPRLDFIKISFWGGGGMTRHGRWVDWFAMRGRVKADASCKTVPFDFRPCDATTLNPA